MLLKQKPEHVGFPFVRGQTLDYAECFKQDNFHNKPVTPTVFRARATDGADARRIRRRYLLDRAHHSVRRLIQQCDRRDYAAE